MSDGVWPIAFTHAGSRICAMVYVELDVAHQLAHQIVGQRELRRARIERAHLDEIPVAREVLGAAIIGDAGLSSPV
jgi:hypothetical protein